MRKLSLLVAFFLLSGPVLSQEPRLLSHPPLRKAPAISERPLAKGPALFVDARKGDDTSDGSKAAPWRTLQHAVRRLKAGDTLYLRGGTYCENVYIALAGRADAPITIRAFPGEQAILDGGFREFLENPAEAWDSFGKGGQGEFRSKKAYPNLREVLGSFGDSMIGLQTYYHVQDLRSDSEIFDWLDWAQPLKSDIKPLYCGPGLWYDRDSGHIHLRLAHTRLPEPAVNYRGPTDPRKLPLILAPFHSVPLTIDQARHLRFQDLVIRGGGYTSVAIDQASDIDFDNVTVWCGAYGIRAAGLRHFRFHRSGLYGNVAPWTFRGDGSKRDYPGRPHRNISRLNTHALLEIDNGGESSVYATPQNDHWEFSRSEFSDAHDALYLGAINVRFHHNLVENLQDDGLYLSPMYHRHRLDKTDVEIHVYQNVFRGMLTALAFGGTEAETRDKIVVYRNLFDLRHKVPTGRPSAKAKAPSFSAGKLIGDHGSPPWPTMSIYHNTFVTGEQMRSAAMDTLGGARVGHPRRVFNNIFFHTAALPGFIGPGPKDNSVCDGNLYWSSQVDGKSAADFFKAFRASPLFTQSKELYPPGSTTHSLVADPLFIKFIPRPEQPSDFRLQEKSPAVNSGVELSKDYADPLRSQDKGRPDIGAFPVGAAPLQVGRASAK